MNTAPVIRTLVVLAVLNAALLAAFCYGAYRIVALGEAAALAESSTRAVGGESDRLLTLERLFNDTEAARARIDTAFVTPGSLVGFIESVEGLGRAAGVPLKLASVEPDKTKDLLHLSLDGSGRFNGLYQLLSLIESAPEAIGITSLSLSKSALGPLEKDPNTWNAHADVDVSTYLNEKR